MARDGSAVAWVFVNTQGHAPSKRFHHTTTLFDGKPNNVAERPTLQAAAAFPFHITRMKHFLEAGAKVLSTEQKAQNDKCCG